MGDSISPESPPKGGGITEAFHHHLVEVAELVVVGMGGRGRVVSYVVSEPVNAVNAYRELLEAKPGRCSGHHPLIEAVIGRGVHGKPPSKPSVKPGAPQIMFNAIGVRAIATQ